MRLLITDYYNGYCIVHNNYRVLWDIECIPNNTDFILISVADTKDHPLLPAYQSNDYQEISRSIKSYSLFASLVLI